VTYSSVLLFASSAIIVKSEIFFDETPKVPSTMSCEF
jgi:hypothetical protein